MIFQVFGFVNHNVIWVVDGVEDSVGHLLETSFMAAMSNRLEVAPLTMAIFEFRRNKTIKLLLQLLFGLMFNDRILVSRKAAGREIPFVNIFTFEWVFQ